MRLAKLEARTLQRSPVSWPGTVCAAAQENADIFKMAEHSRHKSLNVLKGYVDDANKLTDHAGRGLLGDVED